MHYFRRSWGESRGDKYDDWGKSNWWFESDADGYVTRCLQVYQNGNVQLYSESYDDDKYGMLPEGALDLEEFRDYNISEKEFDAALLKFKALNHP